MSGGRVSIGNNATYNPFLYSAGIDSIMGPGKAAGQVGIGEVSNGRNFLNTPGQMLNQHQVTTDKHRDSVNVDAWNVLDQGHANPSSFIDQFSHAHHPQIVVNAVDDQPQNQVDRPFADEEMFQQFEQPHHYI